MTSTAPPTVTAAALTHLAGRSVVLRPSPRHGCCGGVALVPVAETGPPDAEPHDAVVYDIVTTGGVVVHVDRRLGDVRSWTIDVDGLLRWKRLVVLGAGNDQPSR